ncbi:tyrosine-type recombinase/integrase [Micromonospora sp. DSM 115977]|uniref:Tyrosine-type recombinase/integrase n=1 Tax=Micromonospora reichwaldensis TaxID=3075516 RepID=A0ABU2WU89_9ACTN|nr:MULTISPECIES: tyrosine-type recombinase/integrase [unclassified Micromonospora]MDT0529164.1 tyrosine-type recombinase/integrase [Micromonospora sp. DSM 115977]WSF99744.1 tyrosine-type recombinase/integrase [Micromonospora sp. NBC_01740]
MKTFLTGNTDERLYADCLRSLMGLRPAEVRGLRWSDIDFEAGTIRPATTLGHSSTARSRKKAKSAAGRRGLPMPAMVMKALKAFHTRQKKERLQAGDAYIASGYVLVDELGRPQRTDWLRRRVYELMAKLGMRKVRPYDARHACLTYLADVVLAAWAGHADVGNAGQAGLRPPRQQSPQGGRRPPRNTAVRVTPGPQTETVRAYVKRNSERALIRVGESRP